MAERRLFLVIARLDPVIDDRLFRQAEHLTSIVGASPAIVSACSGPGSRFGPAVADALESGDDRGRAEWREARLALRRRVLAGQLRRRRVEALVLPVEPRLARPGALQLVAHVEAQAAETLDLQLDRVAVLEAVQPAMVGAGRQDVAGLQRVDRR